MVNINKVNVKMLAARVLHSRFVPRSVWKMPVTGRFTGRSSSLVQGLLAPLLLLLWLGTAAPLLAESEEDLQPGLTLEDLEDDPLLPDLWVDRPLSPLERRGLEQSLDELHRQGQETLGLGNRTEAFELWFREIRLRRYLGLAEEIAALGQVGESAWNEGLRLEVRLITERLVTIETQVENAVPAQTAFNLQLLEAVGLAYQQVRALPQAIALYTDLATTARDQGAVTHLEDYLQALGQVYAGALIYDRGAEVTQELLGLVRLKSLTQLQRLQEQQVLEDLAFFYTQAEQWQGAIAAKEDLIAFYGRIGLANRIPALKVAIAQHQAAAGLETETIATYREAYRLAQLAQQLDVAQEILLALIEIYRQRQEPRTVLNLYQVLVRVNRQAADPYGMMETYNQLGQFYLEYDGYAQALEVWQRALVLAEALKHREQEFVLKIDQLQQELQPQSPPVESDSGWELNLDTDTETSLDFNSGNFR